MVEPAHPGVLVGVRAIAEADIRAPGATARTVERAIAALGPSGTVTVVWHGTETTGRTEVRIADHGERGATIHLQEERVGAGVEDGPRTIHVKVLPPVPGRSTNEHPVLIHVNNPHHWNLGGWTAKTPPPSEPAARP